MKKIIISLLICMIVLSSVVNVYAKCLLKVNTEGRGQIVVVSYDDEIEFSEEYPMQSAVENAEDGTKFKVGAKADDDWKFVKWTLNGEDYSNENIITVEVNKDMDLVAVFEFEEQDVENITEIATEDNNTNNIVTYIVIIIAFILSILVIFSIVKKKKQELS